MEIQDAKQDAQDLTYIASPTVNDMYLVDYTKIFDGADNTYKYGIMKVSAVTTENVEVLVSELAYDLETGPRKDIRDNKLNDTSYFSEDSAVFTKDELVNLKNSNAIYSVLRN